MATVPNLEDQKQLIEVVKLESQFRQDMFKRMAAICFEKCTDSRYKDGELNVGENTCLDRCASKYWQVTTAVAGMLGAQQGQ